jgi:DNA-binding transcriptional LysR family regulator
MVDVTDGVPEAVAVVEAGGFRAGGRQLGVSGTALSKTLRQLEQRLGVTLLLRTTRSGRLTEAGERFYAASRQALDTLRTAAEELGEMADAPRGTIRLNIASGAEGFLRGDVLAGFLQAYPDVQLDIIVDEHGGDIVAAGYDAGIRLGEVIEQDMIAVPASARSGWWWWDRRRTSRGTPGRSTRATWANMRASGGGRVPMPRPTAGSSRSRAAATSPSRSRAG